MHSTAFVKIWMKISVLCAEFVDEYEMLRILLYVAIATNRRTRWCFANGPSGAFTQSSDYEENHYVVSV